MSKFDAQGEPIHDIPWATLAFDNGNVLVEYFNTWVRTYRDTPMYNHVDWIDEQGINRKLQPDAEAIAKLIEMRFRQTVEIVPSTEIEEWYVAMDMKDVDVEFLRVPEDWSL